MKRAIGIALLITILTSKSQILITNEYTNPGYPNNLFVMEFVGTDTNHVYVVEQTTNLLNEWTDSEQPFQGMSNSTKYFVLGPTNCSTLFVRLLTVGQLSRTNGLSINGITTNIVECITNITCTTNCIGCFTNPPPMPN